MPPRKGLRAYKGFDDILQELRDTVNNEVEALILRDTFRRFLVIAQEDGKIQDIIDGLPPIPRPMNVLKECLTTHFLYPGSIGNDAFLAFCNEEQSAENVLWFAHFRRLEETQMKSANSVEFLNLFVEGYSQFFALTSPQCLNIAYGCRTKVDAMLAKVNATLATIGRRRQQQMVE